LSVIGSTKPQGGVFKVAGGLIHILLVIAVIAIILHFVRGRAAP
jgi:hypothetical protein